MAERTKPDQRKDEHAWQGKPVAAFFIRAVAFTSPIIASVIASIWLSRVLSQPQSLGELVRWWAIILTGSTLVLFGVNWGARRLLPLAALMRLTMVFPDKAPRRFRTALKSGSSVRHLKAQIEEAERIGSSGDQDKAAEFILQLSNALNTHDRRTRGHAERVRAYAEMLAEEMDLNVEDKSKLRWASLLHDIGKLKISPDILNKPGRLNDEEWLEIKKHPSHGADICAPLLDWLGNFANTIEDHHERFDGNGYPNAKKGDEISIGGRIVSVADAYDVMTTVRSYKAAMPANAAREELARNAGGQFDPVVVRAFLNISMGRLRWVAGPLSWLAQLPFLRFVGAVQQVGTVVGVAGVTATGVAAVVGAGIVDVPGTEYLELPTVPGIQAAVTPGPAVDAANDSITATEDTSVSFNPLANDSGGGVITIVDAPDFGRVVINEDGTVTYTPNDDFFGDDQFTYNLVGDEGETDTAAVTVTVTPVNDAPVAGDDVAATDEDTPVAIAVLSNDSDVEGLDMASVVVIDQGLNGFAVFNAGTGLITYTPNPDFTGTDAFRYQVADTDGVGAEARVAVNVAPVNDEPVAEDDAATVDEDGSVVVDVAANDTDPESSLDYGSLAITGEPDDGVASVVGGALTYEPDDDFYGVDSLAYEICDVEGLCDSAAVAITITAVNDAPTVPGPGAVTTDEDVPVTIDLMADAGDIDGDDLTLTVDVASANVAALVNHGDGTVTYWPPPDYYGADTFSFAVSDGVESVSFEVAVTVGEVNDAPVVPGPGPLLVTEDTMFSFDPVAGATDVDGDVVVLDSFDAVTAAGGTVTLGSLEYTPPTDFTGSDSFDYTLTDGRGAFVTVTVTLTVDPVNDAPVAEDDRYDTDEDTPLVVAAPGVLSNDTDVDSGPPSVVPASPPTNGTLSMAGNGSFTYTPDPDFNGVDSFTYTATDGAGGSDTATVTIEVQPYNDAPVAFDDSATTSEDTPINIDVVANDTDPEDGTPAGATSLVTGPASGSVVDNGDGTYTYTPNPDYNGADSFTYTVNDSEATTSNAATVRLTITASNDPPVLDPIGPHTGDELTPITFAATASDIDPADTLTYSLVGGAPSGATIHPATGAFSWTPSEADGPGVFAFDIVVTDNGTPPMADSETITLTVNEVNSAPVATDPGNQLNGETDGVSILVVASDPDLPANTLSFSDGGTLPPGLAINATTGEISGTTAVGSSAGSPYTVTITVTETDGVPANLADSVVFDWQIVNTNRSPVLDSIGAQAGTESSAITFTATASDPDLGDTLAFSLSGAPVGASIHPTSGAFTWTPTEAQDGVHVFDVVVTDDGTPPLADSETITVTVNDVNVAPVLDPVGAQSGDEQTAIAFTAIASDPDTPPNSLAFSLSGAPTGASIHPTSGAFTWIPTEAQGQGVYVFDVVVTDDGTPPLADSETITVTVNEVNVAPVTGPVADAVVDEGSPVGLAATASDSDVPANGVTWSLVSGPGAVTAGGAYSWTPTEADGPGVYPVVLRVTDDGAPALSDTVGFTVTVNEINTPPVVTDPGDRSSGESDVVSLTIVAIDPDLPPNSLSFSDVSTLPPGLSINPGSGEISGTVSSGASAGSPYSVTVTATETDGVPVNLADSTTFEWVIVVGNNAPILDPVGALDVDELSVLGFTATASDPDLGDTLAFSLSGAPVGASIHPTSGAFTWTPTEAQDGVHVFDVVVTDDGTPPLADSETITVTVNDVNVAPVLDPVGAQSGDEQTAIAFTAIASDPDTPPNSLAFSLSGAPTGASIHPTSGAFTWIPTEAQGQGVYVFDVVVTDDGTPPLADSETITVTVNEVNVAPVTGPVADAVVDEGSPVGLAATASDSDVPANGVTWSLVSGPGAVTAGGAYSWTPTEADGPGVYPVVLRVTDDGTPALSDTEGFSITVNEINTPPVVSPVADQSTQEETLVSVSATASDADVPANGLSWTLVSGPGAVTSGGAFSWTPGENDGPGSYTVVLRVTDDGTPSLHDDVSFQVAVGEANVGPVADAIGAQAVDEGTLFTLAATASDADVPANGLTWSLVSGPGAVTAGGAYSWTPTEADGPGAYPVVLRVTDDGTPAMSDTEGFSITVNEVNTSPLLDPVGDHPANKLEELTFTATASDADVPGNVLTYSLSGAPAGASIHPVSGAFSWTPTAADEGAFVFDVVVTDDGSPNLNDNETITVNVNAPPIAVDDAVFAEMDTAAFFDVLANDSDPEAGPLTIDSVTQGTAGGAVSIDPTKKVRYVAPPAYLGPDSFTYTVADTEGATAVATVDVTVVVGLADVGVDLGDSPDPVEVGGDLTYEVTVDNAGPKDVAGGVVTVTLPATVNYVSATPSSGSCVEGGGVVTCSNLAVANGADATIDILVNPTVNGVVLSADAAVGTEWVDPAPADNFVSSATTVTGTVVANPDSFVIDFGKVLDLDLAADLFANDVEPDGEPLSLGTLDGFSYRGGAVVDNGDGTITYTPPPGVAGPDWFTYEVCDPLAACDSAVVTITTLDPILYLRSNGLTRLEVLPLTFDPPTAVRIDSDPAFNYDTFGVGANSDPGLTLNKTGDGLAEDEVHKKQWWDITLAEPFGLSGPATFTFFSAQDDYENIGHKGRVEGFLLDCDGAGANCSTVASGEVFEDPDWGPADGVFVSHVLDFGDVTHPYAAGRTLRLMVTVEDAHKGRMWIGFDTTSYPSALSLSLNDPPGIEANAVGTGVDTALDILTSDLLSNDSDSNFDPIVFDSADPVSAAGGSIFDDGAGTLTYTPPDDFSGLDSFRYDACDVPFAACGSAPVYVAVGDEVFFLGSAGTTSLPTLPLTAPPTALLDDFDPAFNYDTDRDSAPGLQIKVGGDEFDEGDLSKRQWWDTAPVATALDLTGRAHLTFWSAQHDWKNVKLGEVRAFVVDCSADGDDCAQISSGILRSEPWGSGFGFIRHDLALTDLAHRIDPGRFLRVVLTVKKAEGNAWFAFDTVDYPSVLTVGLDGPPIARADVFSIANDTALPFGDSQLLVNDVVPAGGPFTLTPDSASDEGGTITNLGGGSYTYQPPLNFTGLDTFTYTLCDGVPRCDTATVSVAVGKTVLFAGSAGSDRVDVLPFSAPPTKTYLANYDAGEGDGNPGITIRDDNGQPFPADPEKRQWWDVSAATPIVLDGHATYTFWGQQDQGHNIGEEAWAYAYIADCAPGDLDGASCTVLATADVHEATEWGPFDNTFVRKIADFGEVYDVVPAGRVLRLAVALDKARNGRMWFAFDTVDYPAVLTIGDNGLPVASADVFDAAPETPLILSDMSADLLDNDTDPDLDPLVVGRVDAVSASGAAVSTVGDPISSVTYTPSPGYTGLDSFTYDVCDTHDECDTAIVYVAVGEDVYFLGSNGTGRQDTLPFVGPPTAVLGDEDAALNYDGGPPDNDADPGLTIKDGNALATEADPKKRQWWDMPVAAGAYRISGPVKLSFWSAQDNWQNTADGDVHAYLLDCAADGPTCVEVAFAEIPLGAWDAADGTGFVRKDLDLGAVTHTFDPGRIPRLMLAVDKAQNGTMWFAFDTVDYPAVFTVGLAGGPTAYGDTFSTAVDTVMPFTEAQLIANDIYPGEGALSVAVAATSAGGGSVTDLGAGNYQFAPSYGFSGLDSFTYDLCDGVNPCDTGTVYVAVGDIAHFLGSVGTVALDSLPLAEPPTDTLLPDYESDGNRGLTIRDGGGLSDESDPARRQWWDIDAGAAPIDFSGVTRLDLWTLQDQWDNTQEGIVNAYLADCAVADTDGSTCTEFAAASVAALPWAPVNDWYRYTFLFGNTYHTVPAGRMLRVVAVADKAHNGRMWFAFDTVDYPAVLTSGPNGIPTAHDDVATDHNRTHAIVVGAAMLANDTDPDLDPLYVTGVDASTAMGATIVDNGDGTFNYELPLGVFAGVDSFGYTSCDAFGGCDTAEVHVAVGDKLRFLGSNGVARLDSLPLTDPPTVGPDLDDPAFDFDSDGNPGLTLKKWSVPPTVDMTQNWDEIVAGQPIVFSGPTILTVWSVEKDYADDKDAELEATLRDCNAGGGGCTDIATANVAGSPWSPSGEFEPHAIDFGDLDYEVDVGRMLRIELRMPSGANNEVWLAFDHTEFPSVLALGQQEAPIAIADVRTTPSDVPLVIAKAALLGTDVDRNGDPFSITAFDAVTAEGGAVADNGDGTLTYTPGSDFTGADSFTYQVCDSPWNDCSTATVTVAVGEVVRFAGSTPNGESYDLAVAVPSASLGADDPALDYDGDGKSGETLREGTGLSTEPDPDRRQWWDEVAGAPIALSGRAVLTFWSTAKDLVNTEIGEVQAFLLECDAGDTDGSTCTELAAADVVANPWGSADGDFVRHVADFGDVYRTVPGGQMLRMMVTTTNSDGGRLWVAFDTVDYPTVLTVGANGSPVGGIDFRTTDTRAPLVLAEASLLANDVEPDGDAMSINRIDGTSAFGHPITDNGDGTYTYTPPASSSGLDSLTYEVCDPLQACATVTVWITLGESVEFLGSAGSARLDVLPLASSPPTSLSLGDFDGDAVPGLMIAKSNATFDGLDPDERQWWHLTAGAGGFEITGPTKLTFWAHQGNMENVGEKGRVYAYLAECDSDGVSNCAAFAQAEVHEVTEWGPSNEAIPMKVADFGEVVHTVPAGKVFRVMVAVAEAKNNEMQFAFDTVEYPSVVTVGLNAVPVPIDDAFDTPTDTPLAMTEAQLMANDSDPDGDPLTVGAVDDSGSAGTAVLAAGVVTYTPAAGWSGLDEFTYQSCDAFVCRPATARVAVGDTILFLGSAGAVRTDILPFGAVPSGVALGDYDGDATPGLSIKSGAIAWDEGDSEKRQWWHTSAPAAGLNLDTVRLTFWAVPEDDPATQGVAWAHLVECDSDGLSNCFVIASASVDDTPWSSSSVQTRKDIDFGSVAHTVPAAKVLRLVIEAERADGNWMHFGFDTTPYPSVLTIA